MAYVLSIGSLETPSYSSGGNVLETETLFMKEKAFRGFLVLFAPSHLSIISEHYSGRDCDFSPGKED